MPTAIVLLVVTIALARGGYAAWGILALELGALGLLVWVVVEVLFGTSDAERAHYRRQTRGTTEVEILAPGESSETVRSKPAGIPRQLLLAECAL